MKLPAMAAWRGLARRVAPWAASAAGAWLLGACASSSIAPQLYQLRATPPVPDTELAATPAPQVSGPLLQLLLPVTLPEALERDAIVVEQGQAGLLALPGHRWAEPLRDAVPRLLRQDLAALLGPGRVGVAPLPAGVQVQQQLRVDVLALQANAARSQVQLQVRWVLSAPAAGAAGPASAPSAAPVPPMTRMQTFSAPVNGTDVDAIVAAHRLVLWRLAQSLAASAQARERP